MQFLLLGAPHLAPPNSVQRVMLQVMLALVPATLAWTWFFGWGLLVNMIIACAFALAAEAAVLRVRGRPLEPTITDGSAVVTGLLLAFALPPLMPWWITATGAVFAIVFAKHLYGGLGFNPFNPAMAGYVVLLVSFPTEMTNWLPPASLAEWSPSLLDTLRFAMTGALPAAVDAVTAATPLDQIRTGLTMNLTIGEIRADPAFSGGSWAWIAVWTLVGGGWLLYKRVIRWQIPVSVLGSLAVVAALFWFIDPDSHGSSVFHLFSGAAMLCAFFIATDPVSAATTPRGRILYGAGIGILIYVIRTWGGYADGVGFAVLLMNMAVPAIDYFTRPERSGHDG